VRAPLLAGESVDNDPEMDSGDLDIDAWLKTSAHVLRKALVSLEAALEAARAAMILAHKASGKPHTYCVGDLVKISTKALPLHLSSTQKPK
jgi:hypothetical protein